jgi:hypothetical protein
MRKGGKEAVRGERRREGERRYIYKAILYRSSNLVILGDMTSYLQLIDVVVFKIL